MVSSWAEDDLAAAAAVSFGRRRGGIRNLAYFGIRAIFVKSRGAQPPGRRARHPEDRGAERSVVLESCGSHGAPRLPWRM
jgi:hypothetical protein